MTTDELLAKLREWDTRIRSACTCVGRVCSHRAERETFRQMAREEVLPLAEALQLGFKAAEHFQGCVNCGERKYGERWCETGRGLLSEAFYNQRVALARLAERMKELS